MPEPNATPAPLTMTPEKEQEYRAICSSGGTEVDPVFAELDATRAKLAEAGAIVVQSHCDLTTLNRSLTAAEIEVCKCADALIENLDRTKFDGYTPEGRLMRAAVYAMREAQGRIPAKPIEQWLVVDGDFHHLHDSEESATKHAKERGGLRVVHLREVNDAEAAR